MICRRQPNRGCDTILIFKVFYIEAFRKRIKIWAYRCGFRKYAEVRGNFFQNTLPQKFSGIFTEPKLQHSRISQSYWFQNMNYSFYSSIVFRRKYNVHTFSIFWCKKWKFKRFRSWWFRDFFTDMSPDRNFRKFIICRK